MKIFLLTSVFVMTQLVTIAQFKKGTMLIGGSMYGSYSAIADATGNSNEWNIALMPQFGFFVMNNVALGLGANYQYSRLHNTRFDKSWSSGISVNPFVRYYYKKIFFQGMYQFGWVATMETFILSGNSDPSYSSLVKSKTNGLNLGIGYAAMINKSFAIEPLIGYSNSILKYTDGNTKYTSPGFYVQVGFQVYLNRD